MDFFTDQRSNLHLCTVISDTKREVSDYPLIQWCEQYLSEADIFIDIGANIGAFSLILSKKCKEVYAFEPDKKLFDCLCINTITNNRFNIKVNNEDLQYKTLDSYCIKNVKFLRIDSEDWNVFKGISETLSSNEFPRFIIKIIENHALLAHIKQLGYKVYPVGGCNNIYLASDYCSPEDTSDKEEKSKYDFDDLCNKYDSNELQDVTWETLHALSNYYRRKSNHQNAYKCALMGLKIAPDDQHWRLYEEISIVAYYLDKKHEGYQACEKVILSHHSPWSLRNSALSNQVFYMRRLPFKKIIPINYELPQDYIGSSSSLVSIGDDFRLNLRSVNYTINSQGGYIIRDPNNVVR